jgi:hypothetical protein
MVRERRVPFLSIDPERISAISGKKKVPAVSRSKSGCIRLYSAQPTVTISIPRSPTKKT